MGQSTKTVSHPIAVLKLPEYEVPRLIILARSFVNAMANNPRFPAPKPSLASVEAAIDVLTAAQVAALSRLRGMVAARDATRLALITLLQQLRSYVQKTADADVEQAAAIIESAGMAVKKARVLPARVFAAKRGAVSGTVNLVAPKAGERAGYEWAYSTDDAETWVVLPSITVRASTTISGLQPGSTVSFRYRASTKDGTGDWSWPTSMIVD